MQLRSLRTRLVILFLASLAVAATLFAVLAVREVERFQRAQAERSLRQQAGGIAALLAAQQKDLSQIQLTGELEQISDSKVYYAAFNNLPLPGNTLKPLPQSSASQIDWPTLQAHNPQTFDLRLAGDDREYLAVAAPIFLEEQPTIPVGAAVLARPVERLTTNTLTLARRFAPAVLFGVAFALVLALSFGRRITGPVAEMSEASQRIAEGIYDIKLESAKGRDELGLLAASFENMAARLKEADEHERNFLMRISHELRTPLTAIQGHVQAIADGIIDDPDERERSLDIVLTEAARLQRLIGDLLDLAKLEARRFSLNREHVALDEVCSQALGARREAARARGIELRGERWPVLIVDGDGDRLLQIVGNLLDNALRWTPTGGCVELQLLARDGLAVVEVSDTGPGVPAARRETIFRPFVSGDEAEGTGLGLPVASELTAAMGGTLRVDDRPGGGARFTLTFPLLSAAEAGTAAAVASAAAPA